MKSPVRVGDGGGASTLEILPADEAAVAVVRRERHAAALLEIEVQGGAVYRVQEWAVPRRLDVLVQPRRVPTVLIFFLVSILVGIRRRVSAGRAGGGVSRGTRSFGIGYVVGLRTGRDGCL